MLRQVAIYKSGQEIFHTLFGKGLEKDLFWKMLMKIEQEVFSTGVSLNKSGSYDFYKYRICYTFEFPKDLLFIFVTDLTDVVENIEKQLDTCKREFIELFGATLDSQLNSDTFEVFQPILEKIYKDLCPKISLVGFSGVGKTTITRLIRAEEIPVEHIPTITGEIGTIKIGKLSFALWDFAGQDQFSFLWNKFVKGSDAVLIVTDSTLENVEKSRFFVELVKQEAPHAHMAIICNKQDMLGAMPSPEIEHLLGGIHAYSMVATDPNNRDKMITIIADILEISAEVSPLLKPLIDRDKKVAAAEEAIINGDFQAACVFFNQIADLCIELGDDSLSQEFYDKCEKMQYYLQVISIQPNSVPIAPQVNSTQVKKNHPIASIVNPVDVDEANRYESNSALKTDIHPPIIFAELCGEEEIEESPYLPLRGPPEAVRRDSDVPRPVYPHDCQDNLQKSETQTQEPPSIIPFDPLAESPGFVEQLPREDGFNIESLIGAPLTQRPQFDAPIPDDFGLNAATQKFKLLSTLIDLRCKISNLNKFLLDLKIKKLTGEMPNNEFQQKEDRAEQIRHQLESQITEYQCILDNLGSPTLNEETHF